MSSTAAGIAEKTLPDLSVALESWATQSRTQESRRSGRPRGVPSYRLHKQSGLAVVTLTDPSGRRRDVLLGEHGSKKSRLEYARQIAQWETAGRTIPADAATGPDLSIAETVARFFRHAEQHYRHPDGRPTSELADYEYSVRELLDLYWDIPAAEFSPLKLKTVRRKMIENLLSRGVINQRINRIRRLFRWAAGEELVSPSVIEALRCVGGLQRGRSDARERVPVKPAKEAWIDGIAPCCNRSIWGMIQLQRLTGCRPGEVVKMRAIDIDMTGETWVYRPPTHKLAWRNKSREIFIGAQGQAVIKLFLTAKVDDFLFSPRREREERYQAMRLQRKSKLQPSQEDRRQRKLKKVIGEHYSSRSYAKCIADACKKAKVPHWHPNQIRHLHATQVRRQYGIEAAGAVLGHSKLSTTELYAEKNRALAERIAKQVG